MAEAVHLRAADRAAVRWRNGGGWTWEVLASPPCAGWDAFDWRVSIAEIDRAGPFSPLPGVRRGLALLTGELVLDLSGPGETVTLCEASEAFWFNGARPVRAEPRGGPARVLNVMARGADIAASIDRIDGSDGHGAPTLLLAGRAQTALVGSDAWPLDALDALWVSAGTAWHLAGSAHAVRFRR